MDENAGLKVETATVNKQSDHTVKKLSDKHYIKTDQTQM